MPGARGAVGDAGDGEDDDGGYRHDSSEDDADGGAAASPTPATVRSHSREGVKQRTAVEENEQCWVQFRVRRQRRSIGEKRKKEGLLAGDSTEG